MKNIKPVALAIQNANCKITSSTNNFLAALKDVHSQVTKANLTGWDKLKAIGKGVAVALGYGGSHVGYSYSLGNLGSALLTSSLKSMAFGASVYIGPLVLIGIVTFIGGRALSKAQAELDNAKVEMLNGVIDLIIQTCDIRSTLVTTVKLELQSETPDRMVIEEAMTPMFRFIEGLSEAIKDLDECSNLRPLKEINVKSTVSKSCIEMIDAFKDLAIATKGLPYVMLEKEEKVYVRLVMMSWYFGTGIGPMLQEDLECESTKYYVFNNRDELHARAIKELDEMKALFKA